MAHKFRSISFAETVVVYEPTESSEQIVSADIENDIKTPLQQDKRARCYTEQAREVSVNSFKGKPRSLTSPQSFDDDVIKEWKASKWLSTLTLTNNSKMARYVEQARKFTLSTSFEKSFLFAKCESYTEVGKPEFASSTTSTIMNLLPLLQGSAVFSMPYTVAVGGYVALLFIPFLSIMAAMTGAMLIECQYEISPNSRIRKRVRKDYVAITRSVWGDHGARIINAILIFYLFTGDVVNIVLLARSVYEILSPVTDMSFASLTAIFAILCYPTLFITRLTILAYFSFLSVLSVVVAILASLVVFFAEANTWKSNFQSINFINIDGIPLAASIIMFSCLTHSVLSRIESDMAKPSKANKAIYISYSVSAVTKIIFAFIGAVTFASTTQSIVTLNVGEKSAIARYICAISIIGFAVFNYPLNLFVVCENIDNIIEGTKIFKRDRYFYPWLIITRLCLVVLTVVVALVVPYFGLLLAIRGSLIGTCLIFIFPCVFKLKLKKRSLKVSDNFIIIVILVVGLIVGLLGLYSSVSRLVNTLMKDL